MISNKFNSSSSSERATASKRLQMHQQKKMHSGSQDNVIKLLS